MAFIWGFDAEEIRRIHESAGSKSVKRKWIKEGYQYQISIYGVLTHVEAEESEYKRIEILSDVPWTEEIITLIYHFFHRFKPPAPYSIWLYNDERGAVTEVGRYQ